MPILRIQHSVPNFDEWKRAFESDPVNRKAAGVRRYHVHRSVDDPNFVMIDLELDTVAEVQALLQKLQRLWAGPGASVMRNPEAWIVETIESKSLYVEPIIDHIEITVRDISVAVQFYDKLLPLLGFDLANRRSARIEDHDKHVVSYEHPHLGFAITSPRQAFIAETINRRKPGSLHHLAFRAASRAEVDRLHAEIEATGATIVSAPREYPEYSPAGYYAFYFKDPEEIKYEIVSIDRSSQRD